MRRAARALVFVGVLGCGAAFWQGLATVAEAVATCVAPIVLDVTGLATENPIEIAQKCGVAVIDVYNWVDQALASAVVVDAGVATPVDGGAPASIRFHVRMKATPNASPGEAYYYCAPPQFARLQRIHAAAKAALDGGIDQ